MQYVDRSSTPNLLLMIRGFTRKLFRNERAGYLFLLPTLVFLLVTIGYPLFDTGRMAFQEVTLGTLARGERPYIGLENFRNVLNDRAFPIAFKNSLVFTAASVTFQFMIGLFLALLLNEVFPLRHLFRGLLLSGMRIPPIVSGTIFLWLFNYDFGFVNFIFLKIGVVNEPVRWLLNA